MTSQCHYDIVAGFTSPFGGDGLCAGPTVQVDKWLKTGSLLVECKVYSSYVCQTIFIKDEMEGDKNNNMDEEGIKRGSQKKRTLQWTKANLKQ